MKKYAGRIMWLVVLITIIGFTASWYFNSNNFASDITGGAVKVDSEEARLAECLTSKNVVMYGAFWCPNCKDQKKMFGQSFQYVNYVECDPRGKNAQPELCREVGITGYPTWIINGEKHVGTQNLDRLKSLSGC